MAKAIWPFKVLERPIWRKQQKDNKPRGKDQQNYDELEKLSQVEESGKNSVYIRDKKLGRHWKDSNKTAINQRSTFWITQREIRSQRWDPHQKLKGAAIGTEDNMKRYMRSNLIFKNIKQKKFW